MTVFSSALVPERRICLLPIVMLSVGRRRKGGGAGGTGVGR